MSNPHRTFVNGSDSVHLIWMLKAAAAHPTPRTVSHGNVKSRHNVGHANCGLQAPTNTPAYERLELRRMYHLQLCPVRPGDIAQIAQFAGVGHQLECSQQTPVDPGREVLSFSLAIRDNRRSRRHNQHQEQHQQHAVPVPTQVRHPQLCQHQHQL